MRISLVLFTVFLLSSCHDTTFVQGKRYYEDLCQACHMKDGTGLEEVIPSLTSSTYIKDNQQKLPCLIRNGVPDSIFLAMPAYRHLTAYELANIINYINTSWGNNSEIQQINRIEKNLETCL